MKSSGSGALGYGFWWKAWRFPLVAVHGSGLARRGGAGERMPEGGALGGFAI